MAILGVQFVISLTVALFLQKLSPYFSLSRWIMCTGLFHYLHPSNEQLKSLIAKPIIKSKGNRKSASSDTNGRNAAKKESESFSVPCNLELTLERVEIQEIDLYSLYKYKDVCWLIDFSLSALVVYFAVEVMTLIRPELLANEFNQSIIWNCLVISFALKDLISLGRSYWRSEEGGERSVLLSFLFFNLILAMGVLIIDESILDFGLKDGYTTFCENLKSTYAALGLTVNDCPPLWAFKLVLAILSAIIGALFGFPGLRFANIHMQAIKSHQFKPVMMIVLQSSFLLPLLTLLFWINPVSKDLLVASSSSPSNVYSHQNRQTNTEPILSVEGFLNLRLAVLVCFCFLRFCLIRVILQSYLDMAYERIEQMKRETGRILNIDLQRKIARVYYYLAAATLQYVAPVVIIMFLSLCMWNFDRRIIHPVGHGHSTINETANTATEYVRLLRNVFHIRLFSALASYFTWWCLFTSFISSLFGLIYVKMFQ